jgi:hypothetical protein
LAHPALQAADGALDPIPGTSVISGKVLSPDGKTPLTGAQVLAYHLSTEEVFTSEPTDGKGHYGLEALPYGYYDLAVQTGDGLFVGNQVVNVGPDSRAAVDFTVNPFPQGADPGLAQAREFPGSSQDSTGLAEVAEQSSGQEFWSSAKGIAIIAGGGAAVLLAIATISDDDDASPSNP